MISINATDVWAKVASGPAIVRRSGVRGTAETLDLKR